MAGSGEIERKFLLSDRPTELDRHPCEEIGQGYLAADAESEVRVRRRGERRVLTVKRGSGRERSELEIEITQELFESLWPATEGRRLAKRRFYVPLDSHTAEVDVYEGELEGLITAEIEFASVAESEEFEAPPWLGDEITGDPRYANQALARDGRPPSA
jgi:adenylate cyclase